MTAGSSVALGGAQETSGRGTEKAVGAAAVITSSGTVLACAACCTLPLALPAVAVGAAGGVLAWLEAASGWMTGLSVGILAAAWLMVVSQTRRSRKRAASSTLYMLAGSTLLTTLALLSSLVHGH